VVDTQLVNTLGFSAKKERGFMLVEDRGALTLLKPYRVRRREPRYVSSIAVTVQRFLRFGPFFTRGVSLDISTQGMSALVCGAPRVGETVVIELPLRDARIDMLATVRYSTDSKSGFEFYPLSASAQDGIHRWLSELRQHEESLFPCSYFAGSRTGTD
jgi:PilZ domain